MNQDKNINLKEEISIRELYFVIKSNFTKLLGFVLFFFLVGLLYLVLVRPIYTSFGTIIIESEDTSMSSIFDIGLGSDINDIENEIEVLKSRTSAERTVNALLNSKHKNNLHLFNTKRYDDGPIRKFFRKLLSLNFGDDDTFQILNGISDSLLNVYVENIRENTNITPETFRDQF